MNKAVGRSNVRFGSLADILRCGSDVRFTPESGHWAGPNYAAADFVALSGNTSRFKRN